MWKALLLTLIIPLTCLSATQENTYFLTFPLQIKAKINLDNILIPKIATTTKTQRKYPKITDKQLNKIEKMLHQNAPALNTEAVNKVLTTLKCASKYNIKHNNILTIIDFSLPSSAKRLWVFDLAKNKLLFHTHVSHGIKSGSLLSNYFSNKVNSKASSIGVYNTEKAYFGRHGLSLKLYGLDKGVNDNAYNRFIVMHGSWYVNDDFIKKYGRPGRSWGCPTLPRILTKQIIHTIKDNALMIAYYPGNMWLSKSIFLNCTGLKKSNIKTKSFIKEEEGRGKILFADLNNNNKREENEPVVTIKAATYQRIFNTKAPLKRMLRRQIDKTEYIVLNHAEIANMKKNNNAAADKVGEHDLQTVYFVIPVVTKLRGYYATEMKIIDLKKMDEVKSSTAASETHEQIEPYSIQFKSKPSIKLRSTKRFIRWLGL